MKNHLPRSVVLFTLMFVLPIFVQANKHNPMPKSNSSFRAPALRNIDKVELLSIQSRMGNIEKVDATKLVVGKEIKKIVNIWKKQRFEGYSAAACHHPPYAIKFYSKGKVVLFASVCWMCHNITFIVPQVKTWIRFSSRSKEAMMLREIFQKAFPGEKKDG